jgi:hypothetical protein
MYKIVYEKGTGTPGNSALRVLHVDSTQVLYQSIGDFRVSLQKQRNGALVGAVLAVTSQ